MKKIFHLMIFLFLTQNIFAYPKQNPFPSFRIAGNLYYVGADDLACYLIVTSKGNILINSSLEQDVPMLKTNIEKLGFKFSDIKILLISHAHFDHAAGSTAIKNQTHARYAVMDADVSGIESGGRNDFHYANDETTYFPQSSVDKVLHDGDQIKLGDTVLTAHLTPGHTKGNTTWTMQVNENGKQYNVVILGSANVNSGYKLINNITYPEITYDFKHTFSVLKNLPCDIFLGAHAGFFKLNEKYLLLQKNMNVNPFVDTQGYQEHITLKEQQFENELRRQNNLGSSDIYT